MGSRAQGGIRDRSRGGGAIGAPLDGEDAAERDPGWAKSSQRNNPCSPRVVWPGTQHLIFKYFGVSLPPPLGLVPHPFDEILDPALDRRRGGEQPGSAGAIISHLELKDLRGLGAEAKSTLGNASRSRMQSQGLCEKQGTE